MGSYIIFLYIIYLKGFRLNKPILIIYFGKQVDIILSKPKLDGCIPGGAWSITDISWV